MATKTKMTAEMVKDLHDFSGTAKLWKLSEPYRFRHDEDNNQTCAYVITSAAVVPFGGPETYVFPANADGKVIDWCEIHGSFKGGLDHDEAIGGLLDAANTEASA